MLAFAHPSCGHVRVSAALSAAVRALPAIAAAHEATPSYHRRRDSECAFVVLTHMHTRTLPVLHANALRQWLTAQVAIITPCCLEVFPVECARGWLKPERLVHWLHLCHVEYSHCSAHDHRA